MISGGARVYLKCAGPNKNIKVTQKTGKHSPYMEKKVNKNCSWDAQMLDFLETYLNQN